METFKFLEVGYTDDVHKQKEYADMLKNIDYECEAIEKTINNYKLVKEWYLRKMFI